MGYVAGPGGGNREEYGRMSNGSATRDGERGRKRHPIKVAALRTGLSKDVLRAWERRYEVVEPGRTDSGRRLYSDDDIERLRLLKKASDSGRVLKRLALLSDDELTRLVEEDETARRERERLETGAEPADEALVAEYVAGCLAAAERMDPVDLRTILDGAIVDLPSVALVEGVIAPLMRRIGELWEERRLGPSHEHVASSVVRSTLDHVISALGRTADCGLHLVATTPAGQLHEIGAMLVAATAASLGWRVTYLGPDLPVEEIAEAVRHLGADALALSLVHPEGDPELQAALGRLGELLPGDVRIFAGGSAAPAYAGALAAIGAELYGELGSLRGRLMELRERTTGAGTP